MTLWHKYIFQILFLLWASSLMGQVDGLQSYGFRDGFTCDQIRDLKIDLDNYIHISCADSIQYKFDGRSFVPFSDLVSDSEYQKFQPHHSADSFNEKYPNIKMSCSMVSDQGIWIGTRHNGLYLLSEEGDIINRINKEDGLNSNHIISIVKDKWNNLYFATDQSGLYSYRKPVFDTFLPEIKSSITNISVDANNRTWLGTSSDGLYIKDGGQTVHLNHHSSFINTPVSVIAPDFKNRVWIGTEQEGLYLYDQLNRMIQFSDDDLVSSKKITDVFQDSGDRLWIATKDQGIILLQEDDSTFHYLRSFDAKIRPGLNHITDIEWTSDKLWFTTYNTGIGWIDFRDYSLNLLDHAKYNLSKQISKIHVADNHLYALSSDNLSVINLFNEKIDQIKPIESDLVDQFIDFELDKNKTIWLADQSTLYRADRNDGRYSIRTIPVDRKGKNNRVQAIYLNNNTCTIGHQSGISQGHNLDTILYQAPDLKISDIRLFYRSLGDSIQAKMLGLNAGRPSFFHDQNHFGFSFQGRLPGVEAGVLYSYRLLGLNESWSPLNTLNTVNFANLLAGNLTFEVKAIHPYDHTLTSDIKRVSFSIKTPIWRNLWFQLIIASAVLFLGFIILKNRLDAIQKRNRDRESQLRLQNKLLDLERNALQLQMNPHFIFNALNTVKKQLRINDIKTSERILTKFSSLMRNTLEHSRKTNINLEDEIELLDNYLSIEQLSRNNSFTYSIEQDVEDSFDINIPPMMLQPFIENAIQHGVSGQENGGITITFHQKGKMIVCHIKDNGPGLKQPSGSLHKSRAIQVTTDRLALLTDTRKKHLYINNMIDDNGHITGVDVEIWLPML